MIVAEINRFIVPKIPWEVFGCNDLGQSPDCESEGPITTDEGHSLVPEEQIALIAPCHCALTRGCPVQRNYIRNTPNGTDMKDLNNEECLKLLSDNYIGRIAFISGGSPEILPITYYYDPESHSILTYSGEGGKIQAMRKNGDVSFQVDDITALNKWKSVLLYGEYEELNRIDAKHLLHVFTEGVKKTIRNKEGLSPQFIGDFSSKAGMDRAPIVYRINISEIKGRQRD